MSLAAGNRAALPVILLEQACAHCSGSASTGRGPGANTPGRRSSDRLGRRTRDAVRHGRNSGHVDLLLIL
jgi:hypothetical protein